jgi:hypothetical protein
MKLDVRACSLALIPFLLTGCAGPERPDVDPIAEAAQPLAGAQLWTSFGDLNAPTCTGWMSHLDTNPSGESAVGGWIQSSYLLCSITLAPGVVVTASPQDPPWVARYKSGTAIWAKAINLTGSNTWADLGGVAINNATTVVYAVGTQNTPANPTVWNKGFLRAYDAATGALLYTKVFGTTGGHVINAITVDGGDNLVLVGNSDGTVDFGGGLRTTSNAITVVKLDPLGNYLWDREFDVLPDPSVLNVGSTTVVTTASKGQSGIYVGGKYSGKVDFGAGLTLGNDSMYALGLRPNGTTWWSNILGNPGGTVKAIRGMNNTVVLGGDYTGSISFGAYNLISTSPPDVYLAHLDAGTGAPVWASGYGGPGSQLMGGFDTSPTTGTLTMAVNFTPTANFGLGTLSAVSTQDVALVKLKTPGSPIWQRQIVGNAGNYVEAVGSAMDSTGNVYANGTFDGTADFGSGPVGAGAVPPRSYFTKRDP